MKDAIRRRGENVSSFEVEREVLDHPDVLECAAIGVPSELGEEDIKVFVVLRPGADLSAHALLDHLRARSAAFMVPRYVEFLEELPQDRGDTQGQEGRATSTRPTIRRTNPDGEPMTLMDPLTMSLGLENAKVLVTGGGTGIGRATALQFARLGADVAVLGRTAQPLQGVVRSSRRGRRGHVSRRRHPRPGRHDRVFRKSVRPGAAWTSWSTTPVASSPKLAVDMTLWGWRAVVDLNLTGTFICSQAFARSAIARGGGGTGRQRDDRCGGPAVARPRAHDQCPGRRHRAHPGAGPGVGRARHHRQRRGPRDDRHRRAGGRRARRRGRSHRTAGGGRRTAGRAGTPEEVAGLIAFIASPRLLLHDRRDDPARRGYILGAGMHIDPNGSYA